MKRTAAILFLWTPALCLWGPTLAFSQPVIPITSAPSPGHQWAVHELQGLPPLASGPNCTWDFTGAGITATRQLQLAQPATAPGASNFPTASVVAFADNGPPYSFLRVVNGQLRTLGVMTTSPLVYSDPLVTMVFPCTFGTTWTDSYAHPNEQGTRTYTADGYGTLIGPFGSLDNVLKVHSAYESTNIIVNGIQHLGLMQEDVFWHDSAPWPVATAYWYRFFVGGELVQEQRVGSVRAQMLTHVEPIASDPAPFHVYPNPTAGRFVMEFPAPLRLESYYHVYDATGRLLYQRPLPTGATLEEVDLSRFGRGTYMLRVTDPEGVRHERVVVE